MHTTIAMFNHKGGVSKTTSTFNLGWMLAEQKKRVLLIDTDPQCNLTGLILGERLNDYYEKYPLRNIHAALAPAFLSLPREISTPKCVNVAGRTGLMLLPGHVNLSEYEVTLGIAQELAGSIQTLKNLPGAFNHLVTRLAQLNRIDYVLVDMSPSLGSLNQNVLMSSDGFLVPTSPDYFSLMAVNSLASVLPRWAEWSRRAYASETLRNAAYPFRSPTLKFYGTIIQKFRPRLGAATGGFQKWIDEINEAVTNVLFPQLKKYGLTFEDQVYADINTSIGENYCLAEIPDFNTLAATSQLHQTPVFAITDAMFGHSGTVLNQFRRTRKDFHKLFFDLANRIMTLADHDQRENTV